MDQRCVRSARDGATVRGGIVRGSALVLGVCAGLALVAVAVLPAAAAPKSPGLLLATDLPATYVGSPPTTSSTLNALVVDKAACTETPVPIAGLLDAQSVLYSRSGSTTPDIVAENVVSFPTAKGARSAFTAQAKSAKVGATCATVGFVPPGATAPVSTVAIAKVKASRAGTASFASSAHATGTSVNSSSVTFLRGPYVVTVSASAGPDGVDVAALDHAVAVAEKRLTG